MTTSNFPVIGGGSSLIKPKKHEVSIRIYTSVKEGERYTTTITPWVKAYKHTHRLQGGFWTATWEIEAPPHVTRQLFRTCLSLHVRTYAVGSPVWEGYINEMTIVDNGVTRRASTEYIRNAIRCRYTDTSDGEQKLTAWYTNGSSIQRYGRIEETVHLDNVESSAAEAYAQTVLAQNAWPWPELVSLAPNTNTTTLTMNAAGYAFTANYRYVSVAAGAQNLSSMISAVITADCEFLSLGGITTNTIQVDVPSHEIRAWDFLTQLTEIGDGTDPYRIHVGQNRYCTYEPMNPTPNIIWRNNNLHQNANTPTLSGKWMIRPGVLRDYNWPSQPLPAHMFLEDGRDSIVNEVQVAEDRPMPTFKTEIYDESDYMAALYSIELSEETEQ